MTDKKDYMTDEFYQRYKDGIECKYKDENEKSILYMLRYCHGDVSKVSHAVEWGITYQDLLDLCAGYIYGTKRMKEKIEDFLTDINFHYECGRLMGDIDSFISEVLDKTSDYYNKTWNF